MTIEERNTKITEKLDDLKETFKDGVYWSHDYRNVNDPSMVYDTEPTHRTVLNEKGF